MTSVSTIEEIARTLRVHKSTVSRALNARPGKMSERTRQEILEEAHRRGYVPNPAARALASGGRTGSIGFVSRQFNNALYAALMQALAVAVDEQGGNLVTCVTGRIEEHHGQAGLLHPGRVDGIIAIPYALPGINAPDSPWRSHPLVFLMPDHAFPEVPTVDFDQAGGVRQVAEHLWTLGHRRLLFVQGLGPRGEGDESPIGLGRLAVLRAEWAARGADPDAGVTRCAGQAIASGGYAAVRAALAAGQRFTAVLTYNDQMAQGAIAALADAGLRVPEDVSVIGWNDLDETSEFSVPRLTSVRVDVRAAVSTGLSLLSRQIEGEDRVALAAAGPIVLPVTLQPRRSTAPAV